MNGKSAPSFSRLVSRSRLQRLLESPGPTGGYASKPSNEEYPDSVLLVLDNPSHFALYIVASQVHQLLEQDVGTVAVLVLSPPSADNDYTEATELASKTGIQLHWGTMFKVDPTPDNTIDVSYEDLSAKQYVQGTYDMLVLCADVRPAAGIKDLAQTAGIELADSGYIKVSGANGTDVATSQPGIFVAGCASGPKNIKASITDAQAAASAAVTQLNPRLLDADAAPETEERQAAAAPAASPDEMRQQIEQLLYALIGQSDN
jgi:heterodisulfide reductase subunit A